MNAPASRNRTPRWPLSAQIIALMFGSLLVAQAVTLCLTLILPPAPAPQYGLDDIAAAMRGQMRDEKGQRPLTRTVSTEPPSSQTPGWLASEGARAELARMLGANPADVRLLFYTPLPFAGAAAPQRPAEPVMDLPPAPALAPTAAPAPAAPVRPVDKVVYDLDGGAAFELTPVVYQAGPGPGAEGGLRTAPGAPPGGAPAGGLRIRDGFPGEAGAILAGRFDGARIEGGQGVRLQRPATVPGQIGRGAGINRGTATPRVGGGQTAGFGAGPTIRRSTEGGAATGGAPSTRTPIWPDSGAMSFRGLARDTAAAPASAASAFSAPPLAASGDPAGAQAGLPRTAAQVSAPANGEAAAAAGGWRDRIGQGVVVQRLQGLVAGQGQSSAPQATARIYGQRPVDWTVRLPGADTAMAQIPGDVARSPADRQVWRAPTLPRPVETVTTAPAPRRLPGVVELKPPAAVAAVAAAPLPNVLRPAPAPVAAPAASGGFEPARPVTRGLFGLAPAPMIEGDFVAAWQKAPGRWIVVRPTPEAFPNSWQRRVLLWFALSLAVVAPLGYLFARSLTTPLTDFVKAAEVIGRDPSAAVLVKEGPAEVGRAGRAFNQMQRRLKRFVDDRAAVVSALSHDLRAPLLRMRFRAEKAPPEIRAGMLHEVAQMEDMITSVLAFMRDVSEAGPREPVDLRSVLECVIDDAALTGGEAVLESAEDVLVEADAQGVRRALTNLVENALKYGESARARLYVEGEEAVVEIVDKGPGVPETELERVFLPFYRTQDAKRSDKSGVGLGLVSARSMVRAHGGEVSLRNSGAGLIAQVRLPLPREAA
jgi:signal transduction histidine kinase